MRRRRRGPRRESEPHKNRLPIPSTQPQLLSTLQTISSRWALNHCPNPEQVRIVEGLQPGLRPGPDGSYWPVVLRQVRCGRERESARARARERVDEGEGEGEKGVKDVGCRV